MNFIRQIKSKIKTFYTKQKELSPLEKRSRNLKIIKITYWVIAILAIIHVVYLLSLLVSQNRGLNLFGQATVVAVPIDQQVTFIDGGFEANATVVIIRRF